MAEWWSIEVFHGESQAASRWKDVYDTALTEAAITHGAIDWTWIEHRSGVVFEVCFTDDAQWEAFRQLPAVVAALDAVPDRVNGLLVYRGRGGGAGARRPRRPRPTAGAGDRAPRTRERAGPGPDRGRRAGPGRGGIRSVPGSMPHPVSEGLPDRAGWEA